MNDPGRRPDAADVIAPVRIKPLLLKWITEPFDYLFVIEHRSMRPLHLPVRLILVVATAGMAASSILMLFSSSGPAGGFGTVWTVVVFGTQVVYIAGVALGPIPTRAAGARRFFVGSALFCDLGVGSVSMQYTATAGAVACTLLVIPSTLCAVCVSVRWLLAHLAFCVGVIAYCSLRVARSTDFDEQAVVAGVLTLLIGVCLVPTAMHLAWVRLSTDARASLRDPLTGLLNRRGLLSAAPRLWRNAIASNGKVIVIVIDVDHFKRVNDRLGHDAGDAVLCEIATALMHRLPANSLVGRTGGDEFTAYILGNDCDTGALVENLPVVISDATHTAQITASAGAVLVSPHSTDDSEETLRSAVRTSDALMYAAKRAGGNRTLVERQGP